MIPKECKRLAEVDFPIAVVSKHSAREKSIRHGHPSTLHLWWARRPLAACRAMLMALLLPDPADPHCPADFKTNARSLLGKMAGKIGPADLDLRAALLRFIGDFADWDNAGHAVYLEIGRGLVKAAHPDETPLVVDPFAGGGSIPLEALRLGCDAFASDLNPVACLINKVLLEDIPRHGPELADDLRRVGAEVKKAAEKDLAEFYPSDPDGARPIAYLWARTVRCEAPNCGAEIPLLRSFWLCKKAERRRALRTKVVRPAKGVPHVEFEIFTPTAEKDVGGGTVSRAKASCVCCNTVLHPDRVRAQLAAQRGGADVVFDTLECGDSSPLSPPEKAAINRRTPKRTGGARLLAVVTLREGEAGRHYRLATDADYAAVWKAQQRLKEVAAKQRDDGLSAIPDEPLPPRGTLGFRVQLYGVVQWASLFTTRQSLALATSGKHVGIGHAGNVGSALALAISRCTDYWSSGATWTASGEFVGHTFTRQALPTVWDFAEVAPFSDASGNMDGAIDWVARVSSCKEITWSFPVS